MRRLFLDDVRYPVDIYPTDWTGWIVVRSYEDAVSALKTHKVDGISLDHDLGQNKKTGYDLCKWMTKNERWPEEVHFHSMNPVGTKNMIDEYLFYMRYYNKEKA